MGLVSEQLNVLQGESCVIPGTQHARSTKGRGAGGGGGRRGHSAARARPACVKLGQSQPSGRRLRERLRACTEMVFGETMENMLGFRHKEIGLYLS